MEAKRYGWEVGVEKNNRITSKKTQRSLILRQEIMQNIHKGGSRRKSKISKKERKMEQK